MKGYVLVLAAVLVLGAGLRFHYLSTESIDGDEVFTRNVVVAPMLESISRIQRDLVHPPLYYLTLKGFVALFGSGLTAIRTASLLLSLAGIAALGLLYRKQGWRVPATLAALVLALNREHVFQGERARSYPLYSLLVTLLVLWCFEMKDRGEGRLYWFVGGAIMTAAVYTHYVGALYVAAAVAAVILSDAPARFKYRTFAAAAAAAVLFLPWLFLLAPTYAQRNGLAVNLHWLVKPTLFDLGYSFAGFLGTPPLPYAISTGILLTSSLAAVAVFRGGRSIETLSLALAALAPPVLLYGASWMGDDSFFHIRHLLPSYAPWLLLVSCGAADLAKRSRFPRVTFALLACTLLAYTVGALPTGPIRRPLATVAKLITEPPLNTVPAFAVDHYEIGAPVNFHAGTRRVRPTPRSGLGDVGSALLLYRADSPQREVARALESDCATVSERLVSRDVTLAVLRCTGGDR